MRRFRTNGDWNFCLFLNEQLKRIQFEVARNRWVWICDSFRRRTADEKCQCTLNVRRSTRINEYFRWEMPEIWHIFECVVWWCESGARACVRKLFTTAFRSDVTSRQSRHCTPRLHRMLRRVVYVRLITWKLFSFRTSVPNSQSHAVPSSIRFPIKFISLQLWRYQSFEWRLQCRHAFLFVPTFLHL